MQLSAVLITLSALATTALAKVAFTTVAVEGQQVKLEWVGGDPNQPVTIHLRKGDPNALETVPGTETTVTGTSYEWTIPETLPAGSDYAFMISQGGETNYSGPMPLVGTSPEAPSSPVSEMSATASEIVSSVASEVSSVSESIMSSVTESVSAMESSVSSEMSSQSASESDSESVSTSAFASASTTANRTSPSTTRALTSATGTDEAEVLEADSSASGLIANPLALTLGAIAAVMYLF